MVSGVRPLLAAGLILATLHAGRAFAACEDLASESLASDDQGGLANASFSIEPRTLVRLRQIGQQLPQGGGPPALSGSPDGRHVAFVITRAEPDTNDFCMALAVLDLASPGRVRVVDRGGEIQLVEIANRGSIWGIGLQALVKPVWSPDGRSIAYLRRDAGRTQLWVADAAGGGARQVSYAQEDVEQFAWVKAGASLIYATRAGRRNEAEDRVREARLGYRYDERFVPAMSKSPLPGAAIPLTGFVVAIGGGEAAPAGPAQLALLASDPILDPPAPVPIKDDQGRSAWIRNQPQAAEGERQLVVTGSEGREIACGLACKGRILDVWWQPRGGGLVFRRREGWNNGDTAFYRWQPGRGTPMRILVTKDLIDDCERVEKQLVCLRETPTRPAHIVALDTGSGRISERYDPNPELRAFEFGTVKRLAWRNDLGLKVRGDLVLPPLYKSGRLPLVVTTYTSDGFLKGGFGDEIPIQALAARGFAVLSYHRPRSARAADGSGPRDEEVIRAETLAWKERRSIHSAVLAGVRLVVDMGIADPAHVGIAGLSDGSTTSEFALINSRAFAAASVSTCCVEPWTIDAAMGLTFAAAMHADGWPGSWEDDRAFWASGSVVQNAGRIDTPLLIQQADREYLYAVQSFTALRAHHKPVELYVFSDEYHHKWQPAHRLSIYQRNLDWFAFWLQDRIDPDPAKADQYARWSALAREWRESR